MDGKEQIRKEVWAKLTRVAFPDSRFHWDFTAFIPDYHGSDLCTELICGMDAYRSATNILVTPDNNLVSFRASCIKDGKLLIVPSYAIGRGFWQLTREDVPEGQEEYSATLDGLERFANPYPITTVPLENRPQLLVTGASVLNSDGVRLSNGPSYFDLEWLILISLGLVDEGTPVVAAVHDCQVVDYPCDPQPYSVVADMIVVPSQVIPIPRHYERPTKIIWDQIPWYIVNDIPLLRAIYQEAHQSLKK